MKTLNTVKKETVTLKSVLGIYDADNQIATRLSAGGNPAKERYIALFADSVNVRNKDLIILNKFADGTIVEKRVKGFRKQAEEILKNKVIQDQRTKNMAEVNLRHAANRAGVTLPKDLVAELVEKLWNLGLADNATNIVFLDEPRTVNAMFSASWIFGSGSLSCRVSGTVEPENRTIENNRFWETHHADYQITKGNWLHTYKYSSPGTCCNNLYIYL